MQIGTLELFKTLNKKKTEYQYPTARCLAWLPCTRADLKFFCILDMDDGTLSFANGKYFLGVAFRNLKGKTLYPMIISRYGSCILKVRYLGGISGKFLILENHFFSATPDAF